MLPISRSQIESSLSIFLYSTQCNTSHQASVCVNHIIVWVTRHDLDSTLRFIEILVILHSPCFGTVCECDQLEQHCHQSAMHLPLWDDIQIRKCTISKHHVNIITDSCQVCGHDATQ